MNIICRSISNGREFEVPNDYFRSLHALRAECNSYTQAEARYTELLAEHDKQIRAEVLDNVYTELEKYKREINLANTPWNFIELVFSKMKAEVQK